MKATLVKDVPRAYTMRLEPSLPKGTKPLGKSALVLDIRGPENATADWFLRHGVTQPDEMDPAIAGRGEQLHGLFLGKTIRHEDLKQLEVFSDVMLAVARDADALPRLDHFSPVVLGPGAFDGNIASADTIDANVRPGVVYARVVGSTLLVELAQSMADASIASAPNAFLAAIDS